MAARGKNRQFPTAYKLKAIKRVERGDSVLPVAGELENRIRSCTTENYVDAALFSLLVSGQRQAFVRRARGGG